VVRFTDEVGDFVEHAAVDVAVGRPRDVRFLEFPEGRLATVVAVRATHELRGENDFTQTLNAIVAAPRDCEP